MYRTSSQGMIVDRNALSNVRSLIDPNKTVAEFEHVVSTCICASSDHQFEEYNGLHPTEVR